MKTAQERMAMGDHGEQVDLTRSPRGSQKKGNLRRTRGKGSQSVVSMGMVSSTEMSRTGGLSPVKRNHIGKQKESTPFPLAPLWVHLCQVRELVTPEEPNVLGLESETTHSCVFFYKQVVIKPVTW